MAMDADGRTTGGSRTEAEEQQDDAGFIFPNLQPASMEPVRHMLDAMKQMARRCATLEHDNAQLTQQLADVTQKYDKDRLEWREFRDWWNDKIEKRREMLRMTRSEGRVASTSSDGIVRVKEEVQTPCPRRTTDLDEAQGTRLRPGGADGMRRRSEADDRQRRVFADVGLPNEGIYAPSPSVRPPGLTPADPYRSLLSLPGQASGSKPIERLKASPLKPTKAPNESRSTSSIAKVQKEARTPLQDRTNRLPSAPFTTNGKQKTINQEFEIDPAQNGDANYLFKETVRSHAKRKQLHGADCECCQGYYDAAGPVARRPFEEVPSDEENQKDDLAERDRKRNDRQRQQHVQKVSRHRQHGPPPSTPKDYYQINFPDTQRVAEINRSADADEAKRREQIAQDSRFRRRHTEH